MKCQQKRSKKHKMDVLKLPKMAVTTINVNGIDVDK